MQKKIKMVQLFGLPGSGKTTCANNLQSYLKKQNIRGIITRNDFSIWYKNIFWGKKVILLCKNIALLGNRYFHYINFLYRNKSIKYELIVKILKQQYRDLFVNKFVKENSQIYISDHSSIQDLWSILIRTDNIRFITLEEIISRCIKENNTIYIYFDISSETAALNVFNRNGGLSPFDNMSYKKNLLKLHHYQKYFDMINSEIQSQRLPFYTLIHNETIEQNILALKNIMKSEKLID
ncbi:hypothetical protein [uncultured Desulfosarcina sp.]|uniref:hypothetical protein n=1 Tax=uncultured Desulfosarcina sp. TaxID=218289 RepID=UPI0029C6D89B|nr:hypothetical protein [uncultured Desulfosarcina sp.]